MTTEASTGFGCRFQTSNGDNPETFRDYGEITEPQFPKFSVDTHDASHELSPGQFREYVWGMMEAGEVSIEFNLVDTGADYLSLVSELSLPAAQKPKKRRVLFPSGSYWECLAGITGLEHKTPMDNKMTGTATFKITGQPTFVQA